MKLVLFIPHLGYLKHFDHLIEFSNIPNNKLDIFYYQDKNDFSSNFFDQHKNVNFTKFQKRDLCTSRENIKAFEILNMFKNYKFWQLPGLRNYSDLGHRFKMKKNKLRHFPKIQRKTLEILDNISVDPDLLKQVISKVSNSLTDYADVDSKIAKKISKIKPDMVLISPFLDGDWEPIMFNEICQRLGFKTAAYMASWDNFENKGIALPEPDFYFVWSKYHRDVLISHHFANKKKIFIVGSLIFNNWFEMKGKNKVFNNFSNKVLYVCSSPFISGNKETELILKIARILDNSLLKETIIYVKPHPQNPLDKTLLEIENSKLSHIKIVVQKNTKLASGSSQSRNEFQMELLQYKFVLGINTSIQLECVALGQRVYSIDAKFLGIHLPETIHAKFLQRFCVEQINSQDKLIDIFTSEFTNESNLIVEQKSMELLDEFANFDLSFYDNFIQILMTAVNSPIYKSLSIGTKNQLTFAEYFMIFCKIIKDLHLENVKRGVILFLKKGPIGFIFHLKLFAENRYNLLAEPELDPENFFSVNLLSTSSNVEIVSMELARSPFHIKSQDQYREFLNMATSALVKKIESYDHVIFGPWFSEFGFEILYCVPFVNYLLNSSKNEVCRYSVMTRGGNLDIYDSLQVKVINCLEHFEKDEWFELVNKSWAELGGQKQSKVTNSDRIISERVLDSLGITCEDRILLVHPSVIFNLFRPYWRNDFTVDVIKPFLSQPLKENSKERTHAVEHKSIFVKIYARPSLSNDTDLNRSLNELFAKLTDFKIISPVDQLYKDDHDLIKVISSDNARLHSLSIDSFARNLEVQLKALKESDFCIVTYGGLSYYPVLLGKICYAIYDDSSKFSQKHLDLANYFARQTGGTLVMVHISQIAEIELSIRGVLRDV